MNSMVEIDEFIECKNSYMYEFIDFLQFILGIHLYKINEFIYLLYI
jgi:hypothetical protein